MTTRAKKPTRKPAAKKRAAAKPSPRRAKPKAKADTAAPLRVSRRAIFIDVENTSSETELMRVIEGLQIDRVAQPTEVTAVGNWKSVGQKLGRQLASMGIQLAHSAPAIGVRDWSDLWIAVAAGCWLGQAAPGDRLEIVSHDRAFDAVGDAAAARGVTFHRVTYRPAAHPVATEAEPARRRSRRGGRRRRGGRSPAGATPPPVPAPPSPPPAATAPSTAAPEESHGASHAQIVATIARLSGGSAERWINLDVLANALKGEGFSRPPGSPRLVTRLRQFKDLELSPNGTVRLRQPVAVEPVGKAASEAIPAPKRRSRRGGRGRRRPAATRSDMSQDTATIDAAPDRNQ
jgi:hypothetical protein